ncbi:pyrimidine-nucleoside phosphorylase [Lacticaseibacillus camelliae]|uniref:Pyrimidine-nucleoside phosphorylase n=1 Tax=Lacticaseibacillus camelliae DSM 22697 = JCM 13995 TaxID=1423730 RepID=A0A0R2FFJ6_9LACO|nr:pyrimidine-nucleoside phosphorylase [Lacticaseibacillus camelliae]KRN23341.1 pyrimidine-nucleoside phosphorylase [Lacticaseibacillus camelliae DSM 22697 = JCM 13995]
MRMVDLIAKKRDGQTLTKEEINWMITGYVKDEIPDYQMSAFLMATYFKGMGDAEQAELALAMLNSGDRLDLSDIPGIKVDKHSTGGVGDKISIPLTPLVACLGVPVPMISGRGLGHTGGTLDKLESIPGFRVDLSEQEFKAQVATIHQAIVSASGDLAPADRRLYALRDVTATVESIPLIASSIMSKKIASGTNALVFDVKVGNGAFMKTEAQAEKLAQALVAIAKQAGVKSVALLTNMDQPLGITIGNSLEIAESIAILKNRGPRDVRDLTVTLAAHMLVLGGKTQSLEQAIGMAEDALRDGRALNAFKQLIKAQGGDPAVVDDPRLLPQAKYRVDVKATQAGVVTGIDTDALGLAAMRLGGGRAQKDDQLDLAVGLVLHKKLGTPVSVGDTLATLHTDSQDTSAIEQAVQRAFTIGQSAPAKFQLIKKVIQG